MSFRQRRSPPFGVRTQLVVEPDVYAQPLQGKQFGQNLARFSQAVGVATVLLWSLPQDVSALGVQPDTYSPPIQGQTALASAQVKYASAARICQGFGYTVFSDISALGTQPDTLQVPIVGTSAFSSNATAYRSHAGTASALGWRSAVDVLAAEVPDTPTQSPLLSWVGQLARSFTTRVNIACGLIWTPPQDASTPSVQPDTLQVPVVGAGAFSSNATAYRSRAGAASALGW